MPLLWRIEDYEPHWTVAADETIAAINAEAGMPIPGNGRPGHGGTATAVVVLSRVGNSRVARIETRPGRMNAGVLARLPANTIFDGDGPEPPAPSGPRSA